MASFLCPYWWITVSDMKSLSHTIISICHLYHCSVKRKQRRLLLDNNLLVHTWAPVRSTSMWQRRPLVVAFGISVCSQAGSVSVRQETCSGGFQGSAAGPTRTSHGMPKSLGASATRWHRSVQKRGKHPPHPCRQLAACTLTANRVEGLSNLSLVILWSQINGASN